MMMSKLSENLLKAGENEILEALIADADAVQQEMPGDSSEQMPRQNSFTRLFLQMASIPREIPWRGHEPVRSRRDIHKRPRPRPTPTGSRASGTNRVPAPFNPNIDTLLSP